MRRKQIKGLALALAGLVLAVSNETAQSPTKTDQVPTQDGVISTGEYSFTKSAAGMKIGITLSKAKDMLYVAVESPGSGWVAAGLGSSTMNGAYMVLGFSKGGNSSVSEELGAGHRHSPVSARRIVKSSVRESAGSTTLEFSIPSGEFIKGSRLNAIFAFAKSADDFSSRHSEKTSLSVNLE